MAKWRRTRVGRTRIKTASRKKSVYIRGDFWKGNGGTNGLHGEAIDTLW